MERGFSGYGKRFFWLWNRLIRLFRLLEEVIQVNQVKVQNINQVSKLNKKAKNEGRTSILMLILREGLRRFVGLPVQ